MAQTVGTRAGNAHRGDYLVTCAYCGAVWYRSKCRRNAAGQLICPDDQHIRDPVTLSRLNATRTSGLRRPKVDGGNAEVKPPAGPLGIVAAGNIVAGWDASSGVTFGAGARVSAWSALSGGFSLVNSDPMTSPRLKTDGPNGRSYVSLEGAHFLEESTTAFVRPAPSAEPTFYWAVVRRPRWVANATWWGFEGGAGPTLIMFDAPLAGELVSGQFNGLTFGANPVSVPFRDFKVVEVSFTGGTADYIRVGSTAPVSGTFSGNDTPTDDYVVGFSGFLPNVYVYLDICEKWIFRAVPPEAELTSLRTYARAKYGSAVLL